MTWVGSWRNQYGSVLEITSEANGRIEGSFRTALKDSGLYGQQPAVVGVHQGDLISFAVGGGEPGGQIVVAYTGLLRDGRMETLWHLAASEKLTPTLKALPEEGNHFLGGGRSQPARTLSNELPNCTQRGERYDASV